MNHKNGYVPRIGHFKEFLEKLPSVERLDELLDALTGELSPDGMQTVEDVLATFNYYRHVVVARPALHAEFHPIIADLVRSLQRAIVRGADASHHHRTETGSMKKNVRKADIARAARIKRRKGAKRAGSINKKLPRK